MQSPVPGSDTTDPKGPNWSDGFSNQTVRQVIRGTDVSTTQDMAAVGFPLPGVGPRPDDEHARDDDPAAS